MSCLPVFAINCSNNVLSDYTIIGNSVQNGTPTPSSPVNVVSVGDKTENLFDKSTALTSAGYYPDNGVINSDTRNKTSVISCKPNTTYTCWHTTYYGGCRFISTNVDNPTIGSSYTSTTGFYNYAPLVVCQITTGANDKWLFVNYGRTGLPDGSTFEQQASDFMCVEGAYTAATIPNYIPYGYKIPVTVMHNGTTTTTNIYTSAPLRKVGDYADTLNSNGTITRNVGVKTLDGTETAWFRAITNKFYIAMTAFTGAKTTGFDNNVSYIVSPQLKGMPWNEHTQESAGWAISVRQETNASYLRVLVTDIDTVQDFKTWLGANTPTMYYPLATPTTESITLPSIAISNTSDTITIGTSVAPSSGAVLSCILESAGIKIATTKYVATAFADSASELNATMGTIKNVVDNTIIQADRIGKLHTGKQTRPAENCPDGAQCLLITEADGSLHWYPICDENGNIGTQSSN